MNPSDFRTWRASLKPEGRRREASQAQAARALGISISMYAKLESGERACERPRFYGLAMAAILFGLPPYSVS